MCSLLVALIKIRMIINKYCVYHTELPPCPKQLSYSIDMYNIIIIVLIILLLIILLIVLLIKNNKFLLSNKTFLP